MERWTISNIKILKRTFEGATNPDKNDNPVTSKYYTSKKFIVEYDIKGYAHNPSTQATATRKNAENYIDELKKYHNVI